MAVITHVRNIDPQSGAAIADGTPGRHASAGRELLTAEEVALRLRVAPSWVKKAARAGRIPSVPVGRYRRFRWADIEAWLERGSAA